jgi:antitoxin component of MazEF toxin-antitoxin module
MWIVPEKQEIPVKTYDLVSLLSKVTPENIQEAVDFGPPVGKEIW